MPKNKKNTTAFFVNQYNDLIEVMSELIIGLRLPFTFLQRADGYDFNKLN